MGQRWGDTSWKIPVGHCGKLVFYSKWDVKPWVGLGNTIFLAAVLKIGWREWDYQLQDNLEAVSVIQVEDDGGLGQGASSEGGRKCMVFKYIYYIYIYI